MEITFSGKTFVVLGRLSTMTRREAWIRVQLLGGLVHETPKADSSYFIQGTHSSATQQARAEELGCPILSEQEFLDAVDVARARADATTHTDLGDAIARFRGLFDGPATYEVWQEVTTTLDQCSREQLVDACRYVEPHVSRWPTPRPHPRAPVFEVPEAYYAWLFGCGTDPVSDMCVAPSSWVQGLCVGLESPKFELVRRLNLNKLNTTGDMLASLTRHPNLINLRELDVGYENNATPRFYEALRTSRHLPALDTLALHKMSEEHADALCGHHTLHGLRWLRLSNPETDLDRDGTRAAYGRLLEAGWWSGIEGLDMQLSRYFGGTFEGKGAAHAYDVLVEHTDRLPALRHLVLGDDLGMESLFGSALLEQLDRLSVHAKHDGVVALIRHMDENPRHSIRVLDLSRTNYSSVNPLESHRAYFECLCGLKRLDAFDEIVLPRPSRRAEKLAELTELESLAREKGVVLTQSPLER